MPNYPPDCIEIALRPFVRGKFQELRCENAEEAAQAVWDALLAEGWIEEDNFGHTRFICRRRLCIDLPITEGPFKDQVGVAGRDEPESKP